jgi:branched-chain amino acid transport system substrate-binding protein
MSELRKATALLAALTMLVLFNAPAAEAAGTFKIGVVGPLTGPTAEAGTAIKQGAQMAADEVNAKGGIKAGGNNVKLELLFEDSTSKPEVGVSVAEKLLGRDKVNLLVGDAFASSVTMAIMELAPKNPDIPFVSWEPVSGAITAKVKKETAKYANYWKFDFDSSGYARTVFNTIKSLVDGGQLKPKTKAVAFVVEDTDYGRSNATDAKALFEADGWKSVAIETVPLGHTDFYPQMNKLKGLKPDVVVTVFTALGSGVAFSKQTQEVGVTSTQMAVYYPTRPEFIQQAGKASEGLLWTPLMFAPGAIASQKPMADAIKAKYNVNATSDHAYGYDGVMVIVDAISKAGSIDGKKVNDALSKTDFKGILGRYVFDAQGHNAKDGPDFLPIPTAQIQNGKNTVVWPSSVATGKYAPQAWVK